VIAMIAGGGGGERSKPFFNLNFTSLASNPQLREG
jgi:hypothetical protein